MEIRRFRIEKISTSVLLLKGKRKKLLASVLASILLTVYPALTFAFRNLGTPVKEAICWGVHAGPGNTGNWDTLYLSYGQYGAPLFLLAINPESGAMRQYRGPLSSEMGAWDFAVGQDKRIYLGTYYNAHLLRFDPRSETWEDLGRPGGETESFICQLTVAPDGKIWGGTFPSAILFCYDPKTGQTQHFGRMDPDQFYCYPTAGEDGMIYCAIQYEKTDIVIFDPKRKTKASLIAPSDRKAERLRLVKGKDGKIYFKRPTLDRWFRIENGEKLIEIPEPEVPLPDRGLPDGRQFRLTADRMRVEVSAGEEKREFFLQYEASGSFIFVVSVGPDQRIYGSSMLPLRLFVYDPKDRSLGNLGKAAWAEGEIYSMASMTHLLYLGSYPEARLSTYDPVKPLRFGNSEESNPKDLGPMGAQQDRPRAMIAGPHGKVYIGSYPDYGHLGGAISVYDAKRAEKRVYRHVVQNQSMVSLAYLHSVDLVAAGSSVRGGTGTHATEKEAKLILWDPQEEEKVSETVPVPGARAIVSLATTQEGVLYGITDAGRVFIFDPEKREIKKVLDLGFQNPRDLSLQLGPNGMLYGLAKDAIFIIDPKTDQISLLARPPTSIDSGMALLGHKIYYGSGADLWEFEIPEGVPQTNRVIPSATEGN
jgi:hypothetical protein